MFRHNSHRKPQRLTPITRRIRWTSCPSPCQAPCHTRNDLIQCHRDVKKQRLSRLGKMAACIVKVFTLLHKLETTSRVTETNMRLVKSLQQLVPTFKLGAHTGAGRTGVLAAV